MEVSEYFVITAGAAQIIEYRHQWMDSTRSVLRKRWDNSGHHPGLIDFPHHIHVSDETIVQPGRLLNISPLIERRFVVDGKIKSRHTAHGVQKQAGLPKRF